jgi:ABC-type multidrug transport system ATPase subunit
VPLLEVKNLNKYFSDFHAVRDLNFKVEKGDIYGFLGPNGAGKSTSLRMILGLIYPSSGEIFFKGEKITKYDRKYLSQIGALIERPDFYENLSAYNNLKIFARLAQLKDKETHIETVLKEVDLWDRRKSRVKSFSQGMKQRLGIAQALLHEPELIILDEPSNGLDPKGQADMRELIYRISSELQITVIISSHILSEIELIANKMLIINKGEKITEGGVQDLMSSLEMVLEMRSNDEQFFLEKLKERNIPAEVKADRVRVQIAEADIPAFLKNMVEDGVAITEMRQLRTLEEYFLNITK